MAKKVNISFKDNDLEQKIYEFLKIKSELVGDSTYIKQLLLDQMKREGYEK